MPDLSSSKHVSKVSHYQVVDNAEVRLDARVGVGSPGGISVTLGGQPVAHAPDIEGLSLGRGQDLRGKALLVIATAIDANPTNDNTAALLRLTGGIGVREIPATAVADPGQAVIYSFLLNLL